jgi:lipoprotein-releasing system permease protein
MGLSRLIAHRYLFSPKSHSVVNIISAVAAVAVGVPVAAMVILLSVFNGFEGLVRGLYSDFDPEIVVTPAQGKLLEGIDREQLMAVEGVVQVSEVLEGEALVSYRGRQRQATLRGVDSLYGDVVAVEDMVRAGRWQLKLGEVEQAVVGAGVAYDLGVNVQLLDPVEVFVPRWGSFSALLPVDGYRMRELYPAGVFMLDAETDGRYILAPIEAARAVMDYPEGVSALMVKTTGDVRAVQARLKEVLGDGVRVLTQQEQKASLYAIMKYEKWGIFLIIFMVMAIASFAIVGSMMMLIIDKRPETATLRAMGAGTPLVRGVFVRAGMMIAGMGAAGGMALGLAVCWAQQSLGLVRIPARTFLVEAYPVVVRGWDLLLIAGALFVVTFVIAKFTVRTRVLN